MADKNDKKPFKRTSLGGWNSLESAKRLTDIELSPIDDGIIEKEKPENTTSNDQSGLEGGKDTIIEDTNSKEEEISTEEKVFGEGRKLEYYLTKRPDMVREKQETIPVNITQRDLLKVFAAIEGTQMNIIVFNILEDFFEKFKVKDIADQIQKAKKKLKV